MNLERHASFLAECKQLMPQWPVDRHCAITVQASSFGLAGGWIVSKLIFAEHEKLSLECGRFLGIKERRGLSVGKSWLLSAIADGNKTVWIISDQFGCERIVEDFFLKHALAEIGRQSDQTDVQAIHGFHDAGYIGLI